MPVPGDFQPDAVLQEARASYAAGRLGEARRLTEAVLARAPANAGAQLLLGLVEIAGGEARAGLERIEAAARHAPVPAPLCLHFGELRFAGRDFARSVAWLERALAQDPGLAPAWCRMGNALRMLGRSAEAEQAFRRGIAIAPSLEDAYVGLAFLLRELGRAKEAAGVMAALAEAAGGRREVLEKALGFLEDLGQVEPSRRVGERLLQAAPEDPGVQSRVGRLYSKLGRFEQATACFRRAIASDPCSDAAYLGLSVTRRFTSASDPDAELIARALAGGALDASSRTCAHFALGKILDDCGDYDAAFGHFEAGNELHREARPFDLGSHLAAMRRLRDAFPADVFREAPAGRSAPIVPVFVVGMVRSGTTLVERILDSHPMAHGAGELDLAASAAATLGLTSGGQHAGRATPVAFEGPRLAALADEWLRTLAARAGAATVVVDKNPGNFAYLGLLALLFPNARFVHCARDPLDTCLSIYFQHFARDELGWTYDLAAIAEVYADYRRTMAHWRAVLPRPVLEVGYESLARDPAPATRSLLDFVGLPFEPACLEPHRNESAVGTASVWQARQPVYAGSIGRWRRYARHLGPLRDRLLAAGLALEAMDGPGGPGVR